ncbi:MAG: aminotransferase class V-fold PLP-dependent enzyme [Syntrophomonadales bacterium]
MIYLDNAATTYPKPPQTIKAMEAYLREGSANPGRGGHQMTLNAGRAVLRVREQIAEFISADYPERVIFTSSATESLNLAMLGSLKRGDHLIITSMEHNAVARPAFRLKSIGVELDVVDADKFGLIDPSDIARRIKTNTRMVAMVHASNVTGGIMPIRDIGYICRNRGICFLLDASQTAGVLPLDVRDMDIDLLAFPAHKGLYGPPGIGVLYISPGIELDPIKFGGTGSQSDSLEMPHQLPDRYEAGTQNTVGIAGLGAGVEFIQQTGIDNIFAHEQSLTEHLINGLRGTNRIEIYGPRELDERVGVVSFNIQGMDASEVGLILDQVYNIAVRVGLHCAPLAHKTLGTLEKGSLRASFSFFNTEEEVDQLISAVHEIIREY